MKWVKGPVKEPGEYWIWNQYTKEIKSTSVYWYNPGHGQKEALRAGYDFDWDWGPDPGLLDTSNEANWWYKIEQPAPPEIVMSKLTQEQISNFRSQLFLAEFGALDEYLTTLSSKEIEEYIIESLRKSSLKKPIFFELAIMRMLDKFKKEIIEKNEH